MNAVVLAEYHRGGKSGLMELISSDNGKVYRVTIVKRFRSLPQAEATFLSIIDAKDLYRKKIAESLNNIQGE